MAYSSCYNYYEYNIHHVTLTQGLFKGAFWDETCEWDEGRTINIGCRWIDVVRMGQRLVVNVWNPVDPMIVPWMASKLKLQIKNLSIFMINSSQSEILMENNKGVFHFLPLLMYYFMVAIPHGVIELYECIPCLHAFS